MSRWLVWAVAGLLALSAGILLVGADPYAVDPGSRLEWPGAGHWLGTDEQGRDVLARLAMGTWVSLGVAVAATVLSTTLGVVIGTAAGFGGGAYDAVLGRLTEAVQALPKLPMLLLLGVVDWRALGMPGGLASDLARLVLLFGLMGWDGTARLIRTCAMRLRAARWVEAARGLGLSRREVARRHVVPHLVGPTAVSASMDLGDFVMLESGLSFLGLGVPAPHPSLGNLLSRGLLYASEAPWLLLPAGIVTVLLVAAAGAAAHRVRGSQFNLADVVGAR